MLHVPFAPVFQRWHSPNTARRRIPDAQGRRRRCKHSSEHPLALLLAQVAYVYRTDRPGPKPYSI